MHVAGFFPADLAGSQHYAVQLLAMEERSLFAGDAKHGETYRLLWLRTFHAGIAVRVSKREGNIEMTARMLDGQGGYGAGTLDSTSIVQVDPGDWKRIMDGIRGMGFWKLPRNSQANNRVRDGSYWVLEGVVDGQYHVIVRRSVLQVGRYLLELSGFPLEPFYE